MVSRTSIEVSVADLRVGMYVSRLDRPWLDTPFIMQGFLLETSDDIDIIAEYCEFVFVDNAVPDGALPLSFGVGTATFARVKPPVPTGSVQEEHKKTYRAFRKARLLTKSFLDEVRLGAALDTSKAKDMVNDCVQSVLRQPDALLWMSKMREENEYTSDHCLNVCVLCVAFGRHLGMVEEELQNLGLCGLLHDVGKMRVPSHVLDKPGKLTTKEMRMMMAHTVHGRNLLLSTPHIFAGSIDVAYSHHERIDGEGYPRKLAGKSISRFSRIISIVDAYDAMTATRCYSDAITSTEALKIIYGERGKQFDDELSIAFIKMIGLYPPGSLVELYTGELAFVVSANHSLRHLPKVILAFDSRKQRLEKQKILDLSAIVDGSLDKKYLIKKVWLDGSFGASIREFLDKGLILSF